eukprot:CAMPEP_0183302568 /NCGR_PEP_ID=MMETSP0160_2-20130417/8297_1 /TAXON_ID=2839 ORGANISM="Odontella Sinensis, Strain Grunow 1884" /NCGR_SAMPLE_ID=MMETSP0160_2 /ASSEMBLY_ACC=CAM_ASM_000250 /LENGTH=160 /DNA_ID=CAMNT_0025465349 /DNA_START=556 /DNA_END=1038 /DNA_ORIENTATION=+
MHAAACASNPVPAPSNKTVLPATTSLCRAISCAASIDPGHITTPNGSPIFPLSDAPADHHISIISEGCSTSHTVADISSPSSRKIPRGTVRDIMGSFPCNLVLSLVGTIGKGGEGSDGDSAALSPFEVAHRRVRGPMPPIADERDGTALPSWWHEDSLGW